MKSDWMSELAAKHEEARRGNRFWRRYKSRSEAKRDSRLVQPPTLDAGGYISCPQSLILGFGEEFEQEVLKADLPVIVDF